jgi:hypothetical protein
MSSALHAAVFTVGLVGFGYFVAPAVADEWDKMTIFHFNAPVEVPGHVLLPGTYVFKLADLQADRDVVQIFSQDRHGMDHIVTTTIAIPAYRMNPTSKTVLTFEERRSNTPEAVSKWFYPGDNYGVQFVYRHAKNFETAANVAPAPITPTLAAVAPTPAPASQAASPQAAAVEEQQSVVVAQNQPAAPSVPESSANRELPKSLPKTASDLPFAATFGLLMLGAGAAILGFARVRNNL